MHWSLIIDAFLSESKDDESLHREEASSDYESMLEQWLKKNRDSFVKRFKRKFDQCVVSVHPRGELLSLRISFHIPANSSFHVKCSSVRLANLGKLFNQVTKVCRSSHVNDFLAGEVLSNGEMKKRTGSPLTRPTKSPSILWTKKRLKGFSHFEIDSCEDLAR